MCLYSSRNIPYKAKKDIVVCKVLKKRGNKYETPCQNIKVVLGETMIPDKQVNDFPEQRYENTCVEGGCIHAIVRTLDNWQDENTVFKKAIIPAGTNFFIGSCNDIATERLVVTEEDITEEELADLYKGIEEILLEDVEEHNGIRLGDVRLKGDRYIHQEDYDDKTMRDDVIGVVGYFLGGKPVTTSPEQKSLEWHKDGNSKPYKPIDNWEKASVSYDGEKRTKALAKAHKDDLDGFPALQYCLDCHNGATDKGDWYFPSSGEMRLLARNVLIVNITLRKISGAQEISLGTYYWASAEGSSTGAWGCYTGSAHVTEYTYGKWYSFCVRPSFALGA